METVEHALTVSFFIFSDADTHTPECYIRRNALKYILSQKANNI